MRPIAPIAALACALVCASPASAASPRSVVPTADAFVSAAHPSHSYGALRSLAVSARPRRRAFLRFDAGTGARFVLRVYALRSAPRGVLLRHASELPWRERSVTARRAPGTGPRTVRSGPLARGRWASIDVTSLVTGSGRVALALEPAGGATAEISSREAGGHAPRLLVSAPAATAASAPAAEAGPTRASEPSGRLPAAPAPPAPAAPAGPCGTAAAPPAWKHVVWIVLENKGYDQLMDAPGAPYLNRLAGECGLATAFTAETHPSLPNYIAMTSGATQGIVDDLAPGTHPLAVPSIFSQLGTDWRALEESMPSNCALKTTGLYAVRHNPAAYYTGIRDACATQDVPLADPPDLSARFTFITPNLCSDMHDCDVTAGDTWLSQWVPKILATPEYRSGTTAVFITCDEDGGLSSQRIVTLALSPSTPAGTQDSTPYTHYSMLRTTEEMLGLPPILGAAATATSMRAGMHL